MNVWIIIGIAVVAFILGYKYAMIRYKVKTAYKILDLFSEYMLGKITIYDLSEKYNEITKNIFN